MKKLSLSAIGCGNRTRLYLSLAAEMNDRYEIVAAADPNLNSLNQVKDLSNNPNFQAFHDDQELLAMDKLADVMIIGTQDNYHYEPCKAALLKGYDVLLEKPISPSMEEILELQNLAEKLGRKLKVCYVLRYTPFYRKVKEIIDSGVLGEIISMNATEGVDPWHQAHSFVRGNWSHSEQSTPMILAKCSHDTDIIGWLLGKRCLSVSSYGSLEHFRSEKAPAGATKRCTDGCPHLETCHYNAYQYVGKHRDGWLRLVYDHSAEATDQAIVDWLKVSDYGRCVYFSDNDVVDHQIVSMEFEDSVTASLTMTAFEYGRTIEIFGTKGILKGGQFIKQVSGSDIHVQTFAGEKQQHVIGVDSKDCHMGGDAGLMESLYNEMIGDENVPVSSYIQSHVISFSAEYSRVTKQRVEIADFERKFTTKK